MAETETTTVQTRETQTREDKPYLVIHQILDFFLFLIEGFLLLRLAFQITGANPASGFVSLVYSVSAIFMIPFRFIFPSSSAGEIVVEWSVLVAMLVYALVFYAIRKAIAVAYTADTA